MEKHWLELIIAGDYYFQQQRMVSLSKNMLFPRELLLYTLLYEKKESGVWKKKWSLEWTIIDSPFNPRPTKPFFVTWFTKGVPPPLWTWNWRAQSMIVWYHGIG